MNKVKRNAGEGYTDLKCTPYNLSLKTAYICSPFNADTFDGRVKNMLLARSYMAYATEKLDVNARAPHAYLPMVIFEERPEERQLALEFGQKLLACCDIVFVCGSRLSKGMEGELQRAASLNMEIVVFDPNLYIEVKRLMICNGALNNRVRLERGHYAMERIELDDAWKEVFNAMHI